ncbi:hypothetical protein [Kutzneria chonburiensis]|uniref:Uncharacterized protein n=1 Tax=Kutzneria chonburiensis TaxID=1483604 RepID=A0ABV6MNZ4_9PSEU|nr:hypothetical protein [Kutzneria chonburiensis]
MTRPSQGTSESWLVTTRVSVNFDGGEQGSEPLGLGYADVVVDGQRLPPQGGFIAQVAEALEGVRSSHRNLPGSLALVNEGVRRLDAELDMDKRRADLDDVAGAIADLSYVVELGRHSGTLAAITRRESFGVNVIGFAERWLATRFAASGGDRFAGVLRRRPPSARVNPQLTV